ncbi:hypothetical protein OIDMADRAFT_17376 [Oidiodendron maius Zn]|uniref:DNA-directed RNA polymerase subunit n=1 Tax=Oidiodendron maius (strain Zn) TaxID=913774 RepID=A0A0C3HWF7_OIDMZ|nr:hypothetical protein OIDMADRAFT_17376 [Oidiodendron maius Zn]
MAIQFCDDCGDTLPVSVESSVKCDCCGSVNQNVLLSQVQVSTTTKARSKLRDKLNSNVQVVTAEDAKGSQQRTDKNCPKCDKQDLIFTQAQLRSADEGTTLFYYCLSCSHRFVENN